MRALVTGACGFAGGFLVRHLLDRGDEVTGTLLHDATRTTATAGLDFKRVTIDLTDAAACQALVQSCRPEVVYHLAGIAFVPEAEENFGKALEVNVGIVNNLVRACHLLELKTTFVYISSAEVYGKITPAQLPITETQTPRPANNYSLSKLMGELVVQRYEIGGFIRPVIMRPFNHIGPGQDSRFVASSFARQLAAISLGQAAPIMKVGNLEARRDFSDVRDIVRAYRLAAQTGKGTYNLGLGRAVPVREILQTLIALCGVPVDVQQDPSRMRAAEVPEVYGSYACAQHDFGWKPTIELRQSLQDIFEYWKKELSAAS